MRSVLIAQDSWLVAHSSKLHDVGNSCDDHADSRIQRMSPEIAIAVSTKAVELEKALRRVIRGKDDVVRLALVSIFARGHLLIEGVPGVGKTTLGQALARAIDCTFQRVQFTSDMLPSDVLGISVYSAADQRFEFKRGPVFTNVLLADEINRTTPKTQSALLEAMNEGQVTVDAHSYVLPQPFLVIATQNPVEHHGTYPLPESQLDRFLMRVRMGYPDAQAERQILRSEAGVAHLDSLRPVLTGGDVLEMQEAVKNIRVDDSLVSYALEIVRRTRESEFLSLGVSPRGSQALYRAAQAMAFLEGRTFCTPEDFKPLVVPVFAHRVVVNNLYASTLRKSEQSDQVLKRDDRKRSRTCLTDRHRVEQFGRDPSMRESVVP